MDTEPKFFGTDGIRGVVGEYPITVDFILKLGWAVGMMLSSAQLKSKVLIGKDTRTSSYMIESALQAGLDAAGADTYLLGPMPTPGVAYLTQAFRADMGIVISASHNRYDNNGIKFFSAEGFKLPKAAENNIEHWLSQPIITAKSSALGRSKRIQDAAGRYIEYCKSSIPHNTKFKNLKLVIDCANGAGYHIAPHVFTELGAHVIAMNDAPNGTNINDQCGSMHPSSIQKRVLAEKADVGIAIDGDGDRLLMIDHLGEIVDGDEVLYIFAKSLFNSHKLQGGIVGTDLSNTGLEIALNELGIHFLRVPVGDQHIIHALKDKQWLLGGEPSGHIIYTRTATAADGIIAALQILLAMFLTDSNLHELKSGMKKIPQQHMNIPHHGQQINFHDEDLLQSIKQIENKLHPHGRVLLRNSGTEPVIRLMIEGEDEKLVTELIENLGEQLKKKIKA